MKQIKLNPDNLVFRLNRLVYGIEKRDQTSDGCILGWQLIFLPLVLVLTIPLIIAELVFGQKVEESGLTRSFFGMLFSVFLVVLGGVPLIIFDAPDKYFNPWFLYILGFPMTVLVGLIFFCIVSGIGWIIENWPKSNREDKEFFIVEWVKAKKEKSCPQIKWTKNEN